MLMGLAWDLIVVVSSIPKKYVGGMDERRGFMELQGEPRVIRISANIGLERLG